MMASPAAPAADVLVVGAGPAGLAVAIAATLRGLRARVVDIAAPPLDKACGEGLLPDALASLAALGVGLHGGHPIAGIRFHDGARQAEAHFAGAYGRGLRRTALHQAMLARAAALGIVVEGRTTLPSLESASERFLIGADGGQSRVRFLAGLDITSNATVTTRRIGLRRHFALRPWSNLVEVFWAAEAQAYVTPVGEDEIGVAFLSRRKFSSIPEALRHFPALQARLGSAPTTSTPRGAATLTRTLRRVTASNRIALIGDASGSVDAITGEGLNLCFRQAEALAEAMALDRLDTYEAAHPAIMRLPRIMSTTLLALDRSAALRAAAVSTLGVCPPLFNTLLRLHAGAAPNKTGNVPRPPCFHPALPEQPPTILT